MVVDDFFNTLMWLAIDRFTWNVNYSLFSNICFQIFLLAIWLVCFKLSGQVNFSLLNNLSNGLFGYISLFLLRRLLFCWKLLNGNFSNCFFGSYILDLRLLRNIDYLIFCFSLFRNTLIQSIGFPLANLTRRYSWLFNTSLSIILLGLRNISIFLYLARFTVFLWFLKCVRNVWILDIRT